MISTARSRFGGSSTVALSAPVTSSEVVPALLAEAKQACADIASDAQSHPLAEMNIFRREMEALGAQRIPKVSSLVARVQVLEESNIQAGTADEERNN